MNWIAYLKTQRILKWKLLSRWLLPRSTDYQKFVILTSPRSGSTWFHTLLNSHPGIVSKGEIITRKSLALDDVYDTQTSAVQAVGCKIFYGLPAYAKALDAISSNTDIKIILLTRGNGLDQYVSLMRARNSRKWSGARSSIQDPLHIDKEALSAYLDEQKEKLSQTKARLKEHMMLEISYEALVEDPVHTLHEVQLFLNVTPRQLFSLMEKEEQLPLEKRIANWKEIEGISY